MERSLEICISANTLSDSDTGKPRIVTASLHGRILVMEENSCLQKLIGMTESLQQKNSNICM